MVAASEGLLAMLTVSNTSFGALTGARSGGLGHLVLACSLGRSALSEAPGACFAVAKAQRRLVLIRCRRGSFGKLCGLRGHWWCSRNRYKILSLDLVTEL